MRQRGRHWPGPATLIAFASVMVVVYLEALGENENV